MQRCQFRFLNQSLPSSRYKPEKTTRKIREKIRGVFGRFEKHISGPEKFTQKRGRKEPRKVFGPEKFSGLLRNARQGPKINGKCFVNVPHPISVECKSISYTMAIIIER